MRQQVDDEFRQTSITSDRAQTARVDYMAIVFRQAIWAPVESFMSRTVQFALQSAFYLARRCSVL